MAEALPENKLSALNLPQFQPKGQLHIVSDLFTYTYKYLFKINSHLYPFKNKFFLRHGTVVLLLFIAAFFVFIMYLWVLPLLYVAWLFYAYHTSRNEGGGIFTARRFSNFTKGRDVKLQNGKIFKAPARITRAKLNPTSSLPKEVKEITHEYFSKEKTKPFPPLNQVTNKKQKLSDYSDEYRLKLIDDAYNLFGFVTEGNDIFLSKGKLTDDEFELKKLQYLERLVYPDEVWRVALAEPVANPIDRNVRSIMFMDILQLGFWQYVVSDIRSGFRWIFLSIGSILRLTINKLFYSKVAPSPDYSSLIAEFLIETSYSLQYFNTYKLNPGANTVAIFLFNNFSFIDNYGELVYFSKLAVHVDIVTRKAINLNFYNYETLDDMSVKIIKDPKFPFTVTYSGNDKKKATKTDIEYGPIGENLRDALTVLYYYFSVYGHPKLHAFANWASVSDCKIPNYSELSRLSSITTQYNYFGFSRGPVDFPLVYQMAATFGIIPASPLLKNYSTMADAMRLAFVESVSDGLDDHRQIYSMMEYSDFVYFINVARLTFKKIFDKHLAEKLVNIGIDPRISEPLFIGSVFHSLDHFNLKRVGLDPLWVSPDSKSNYLVAGAVSVIVAASNTDDLPLQLSTRIKHIQTEFHQEFYHEARKINPYFAEFMDGCICK